MNEEIKVNLVRVTAMILRLTTSTNESYSAP